MKTFFTIAVGLSFLIGPSVCARTGGGPADKAKTDQTAPAKRKVQPNASANAKGKAAETKKVDNKAKDSESWDWGNKKKAKAPKAKSK